MSDAIAWLCEDLIFLGERTITMKRDQAEARERNTQGWRVTPLYAQTAIDMEKKRADALQHVVEQLHGPLSIAVLEARADAADAALKTANASNFGLVRLNEATQLRAEGAEAALMMSLAALGHIEAEARRYAAMYDQGTDGRNTFIIFANMVSTLINGLRT